MKIKHELIQELHDELVPNEGNAKTIAGEIVRAISRLVYRFYNDGDIVGIDYGNETCNGSARYLESKFDELDDKISYNVSQLWDSSHINEIQYEEKLAIIVEQIAEFIENNPQIKNDKNTEDSRIDYSIEDDFNYDDEDEEYDYWDEDEEEW